MSASLLNRRSVELFVGALLAAAIWVSFSQFATRRSAYHQELALLDESVALADQIKILRAKPDRAAAQSRSDRTLAEAIEASAIAAGVAREQIARIEPQTPRRAGDADYLEHSTVVQFDGVALRQLADAFSALRSGPNGLADLKISTLRISAPFQGGKASDVERWNCDLTLTYYVYSPKTGLARKS